MRPLFLSPLYLSLLVTATVAGSALYTGAPAHAQITQMSTEYPEDPDDARRIRRGRLTGEDGLTLMGGDDRDEAAAMRSGGMALPVNSYLWQASLDTVSFMPLQSTDPFGGAIITEWYELPEAPGERFKLHVLVRDKALRADGVKVQVFKQQMDAKTHQWREVAVTNSMSRDFEDIILTRARELRTK